MKNPDNLPRAIPVPDYIATPAAIMALFTDDDVVLRPAEIISRLGRGESPVRKALTRLVRDGSLHRVATCQYARVATAKPRRRPDRFERIAQLIEDRARFIGGPAHAAMLAIAQAIRETT